MVSLEQSMGIVGLGKVEFPHDAQDVADITAVVSGGAKGALDIGIIVGGLEDLIGGIVGNQAVLRALQLVEHDVLADAGLADVCKYFSLPGISVVFRCTQ